MILIMTHLQAREKTRKLRHPVIYRRKYADSSWEKVRSASRRHSDKRHNRSRSGFDERSKKATTPQEGFQTDITNRQPFSTNPAGCLQDSPYRLPLPFNLLKTSPNTHCKAIPNKFLKDFKEQFGFGDKKLYLCRVWDILFLPIHPRKAAVRPKQMFTEDRESKT